MKSQVMIFHPVTSSRTVTPEERLAEAIVVRAFKDYADAMRKLTGMDKIPKEYSRKYYEKVINDCIDYFESPLYSYTTSLDYKEVIKNWKEIDI